MKTQQTFLQNQLKYPMMCKHPSKYIPKKKKHKSSIKVFPYHQNKYGNSKYFYTFLDSLFCAKLSVH